MNDKNFNLPKNIKQIGSIDNSLKIYIEDYAFTFMQQYSKDNQEEDKIALLVGEQLSIDGLNALFISAVIKPKYTTYKNSMEVLTEKSFDYVQQQIDTYFHKLKIVGWFYSRPGFEKEIDQNYIKYHKQTFFTDDKVLFLHDPLEKTGAFFNFSSESDKFNELKGFIIYYERNEAMSEYMLNNSFSKNPELEEKKAKEAKLKEEQKEIKEQITSQESKEDKESLSKVNLILPQKAKLQNSENKKTFNIFGSLTAVLILISFVMGVGLIQNEDRITKLEDQLANIDESYKYLLLQVTNQSVQSVFAESTNPLTKDTPNSKDDSKDAVTPEDDPQNQSSNSEDDISKLESNTENNFQITQQQTSYDKLQENQNSYLKENSLETSYNTYVIKDGDNLEKISRQFYGNAEKISEIMFLNNIEDADKIYSGMSIKLP